MTEVIKGITEIYDAYYETLSRGKKGELTKFINHLQWTLPRKTMSRAIAVFMFTNGNIANSLSLKITHKNEK